MIAAAETPIDTRRERGIIFSDPMVRAIEKGQKTQTRRLMNPQPEPIPNGYRKRFKVKCTHWWAAAKARAMVEVDDLAGGFCCPYGARRDRLWVREAWTIGDGMNPSGDATKPTFRADWLDADAIAVKWRSPLYLPRKFARLVLEITDVRAQRLHEISEDDACAEGIERDAEPCDHIRRSCAEIGCLGRTFKAGFCRAWERINGKRAAWSSNPWVWAISFRRVS